MNTPTYIKSFRGAVLWSWGNYRYTIDANGCSNKMIMENTDLEFAVEVFDRNFGELA